MPCRNVPPPRRGYTDSDGYMVINHQASLGSITYRNVRFDLDDEENRKVLLETLERDNVITTIDEPDRDIERRGNVYRVVHPDYRFLNRKRDGKENRMKRHAILLNLKHNTHLLTTVL